MGNRPVTQAPGAGNENQIINRIHAPFRDNPESKLGTVSAYVGKSKRSDDRDTSIMLALQQSLLHTTLLVVSSCKRLNG
jgi:hypothetical protein